MTGFHNTSTLGRFTRPVSSNFATAKRDGSWKLKEISNFSKLKLNKYKQYDFQINETDIAVVVIWLNVVVSDPNSRYFVACIPNDFCDGNSKFYTV